MICATKAVLHPPSIMEFVEKHTRAATYVKVLAKMECTY